MCSLRARSFDWLSRAVSTSLANRALKVSGSTNGSVVGERFHKPVEAMLRKSARQLASDYSPPPWPPRPCQFSARLLQFRLKPRLVGMKGGVAVSQGFQFIEHGCHVARHANLIGPGVPEQRRF